MLIEKVWPMVGSPRSNAAAEVVRYDAEERPVTIHQ